MTARKSSKLGNEERRFWILLGIAFGLRLVAAATLPAAALPAATLGGLGYVLLTFAIERKPHRRDAARARRSSAQRSGVELLWPAVTAFVSALVIYCVLIPAATAPTAAPLELALYPLLDVYFTVRFLQFRSAAPRRRWRTVYTLAPATTLAALIGDAGLALAALRGDASPSAGRLFAGALPLVLLAAVVWLRRTRLSSPPADRSPAAPPAGRRHDLPEHTLLFALLLPALHFAAAVSAPAHGLLLDAAGTRAREVLLVGWLVVMGALALLQHRFLKRSYARLEEGAVRLGREADQRRRAAEERRRFIAELENKNAEIQAKSAEMERFTYAVSHDLKSPLVTIQGFLGYVERDFERGHGELVAQSIGKIRNAADKMRQLLDELLELARIGRTANPAERVELRAVACEALERVAGRIAARGVEVVIAGDLPTVTGDRSRLLQVFQNLIENAVKFLGDQPAPRLEIGAIRPIGKVPRPGPAIFVRDNGIGIDRRFHHKVFGLFDKLDPLGEGTGIGLALVKRIMEVHGGEITVESDGAGQGTTFWLSFPAEDEVEAG